MTPSIRLGRLFGIEIGANWSLATSVLSVEVPGQSVAAYWLTAAAGAVVFYACLLAHEMSHALVARRSGVKVAGITLWLFGGVSRLDGEPQSAGAEALIAGVGPLTSFVIAGLSLGLAFATTAAPLVADLFGWLAFVNA